MSTDLVPTNGPDAMVAVATGRVTQEVQAAMTIAKKCPRDETAAIERIRQACTRVRLAEQARYSYPRGGKKVEGPSVRLAEVMAQNWGNLDFGIVEVEQRQGESTMMAYCWDLETNTRQTKTFTVRHWRDTRGGGHALSDARDVYEITANMGARRMRACILGIIPGDVQDVAIEQCHKTLAGDSKEPVADRVRKMVAAFSEFSVNAEMIERKLGHKVDACDEYSLVDLRGIYQSLRDGMSKREDWFDVQTVEAVETHREQARQKYEAEQPPAENAAPEPPKEKRKPAKKSKDNDATDSAQLLDEYRQALEHCDTVTAIQKDVIDHANANKRMSSDDKVRIMTEAHKKIATIKAARPS